MSVRNGLLVMIFGFVGYGMAGASEPGCYGSAEAAAAQVGVRGVTGFRLESTRRDVFSGTVWASVRSCQHPERPALLVLASAAGAGERAGLQDAAPSSSLIMLAGTSVRVFESSENVRLEMPGVVQASGRLGDRVRVRLVPVTAGGSGDGSATEQFATGIVRSRNVIELETR